MESVEFLKSVLEIQSKSGKEDRMVKFIKSFIKKLKLKYKTDEKGNIYCHKGDKRSNRPFVVAHMDTVHSINDDVIILEIENKFMAIDTVKGTQYGVGGDDKVGVWAALSCLKKYDNISVAFFVDEERGCVGSSNCDMEQFNKANWIAQLDRRENEDFIVYKMASEKFIEDMSPLADAASMEVKDQYTVTDVSTLYNKYVGVSCVNIASGYYRPHTDSEIVHIGDALNSLELLYAMIEMYGMVKYPHEKPKHKPKPKNSKVRDIYPRRGYQGIIEGFNRHHDYDYYDGISSDEDFATGDGRKKYWNPILEAYEVYNTVGSFCFFLTECGKLFFKKYLLENYKKAHPEKFANNSTLSRLITMEEKDHDLDEDPASIAYEEAYEKYGEENDDGKDNFDRFIEQDEYASYDEYVMARQANEAIGREGRRNYHHFEEERFSESEVARFMAKMRQELDAALFMFATTYEEWESGLVREEIIKNCSAFTWGEYGRTLKEYERIFDIPSPYPEADYRGAMVAF
jgi:putative aminopeptidase FrvX